MENLKQCLGCKKYLPTSQYPILNEKFSLSGTEDVYCISCNEKIKCGSLTRRRWRDIPGTPQNKEYMSKRQAKRFAVGSRMYSLNQKANIKRVWGLTLEEYDALVFDEHKGKCDICSLQFDDNNRPVLDHCHTTEKIVGILCNNCNRALGLLFENPEILLKASKYASKCKIPKKDSRR